MFKFNDKWTADGIDERMACGGRWLSAARSYVQSFFWNGSSVMWGSTEELKPNMTIEQAEQIATVAAKAAFYEAAEDIRKLQRENEELRERLEKQEQPNVGS